MPGVQGYQAPRHKRVARSVWAAAAVAAVLLAAACSSSSSPAKSAMVGRARTPGASATRAAPPPPPPSVSVSRVRSADGSVVTVATFRGPVRFALHNGSADPGYRYSGLLHAGPNVTGTERQRLLAAFNGGFLLSSHSGGYEQEGHVLRGLRDGLGTLVIDRSGQARVGVWGPGLPAPGEAVYSARQNLAARSRTGSPPRTSPNGISGAAHSLMPSTSPAAASARTPPATSCTPRACPLSPPIWPAR